VELLYPACCAGCDQLLPDAGAFCSTCAVAVEPAGAAPPGAGAATPSGPLLPPEVPLVAPYLFGGQLAVAIRRLKYAGTLWLSRPLGTLLADGLAAQRLAGQVDVVVPVPLHPRRQRQRGFNQAALLARAAARQLGAPLEVSLLCRPRHLEPQATLEAADRRGLPPATALAATSPSLATFEATARGRRRLPGQRVLLVDDVITTGATARAAWAALVAAGAAAVTVAVLARTVSWSGG
jgi:ComF family protein